jgi:hypothetical protein
VPCSSRGSRARCPSIKPATSASMVYRWTLKPFVSSFPRGGGSPPKHAPGDRRIPGSRVSRARTSTAATPRPSRRSSCS